MAFKTFQPATRGQPLPQYGSDDLTISSVVLGAFSFSGTASRMSYWMMLALSIAFNVTLAMVALKVFGSDLKSDHPPALFALFFPIFLGFFWYQLATFVRRLRDRGWSNTAIVIVSIAMPTLLVVPYVRILVLLACLWLFVECAILGSAD